MSKNIDKRLWGVLGKQQTFFSPQKQVQGKTKVPLNANAFDSWDVKRSRFRRVDGYENAIQQGGVVPQATSGPVISPTPSPTLTQTPTNTPSPTPSFTPTMTQTQTPSLTPSSTPYPLPLNPTIWLDASDSSTLSLINSGGTNYVSTWSSKGTSTWVLSGASTDRMPIYSASTLMPGNPNCVRFTTNATTTLQDGLMAFDRTPISYTGGTLFMVVAKPSGSTYAATSFVFNMDLYSGFTNGGFVASAPTALSRLRVLGNQTGNIQQTISGYSLTNTISSLSATNLNDKFLIRNSFANAQNQFAVMEINQSAFTSSLSWTASTATNLLNAITIGLQTASAGTQTYSNQNAEFCEVMFYNTTLSNAQVEQVELYLKDKWRYDEWASPVPTPTPTASPTQTTTNTPTPTPSATPPFNPINLNPMIWLDFNDVSTLTFRSGTNFISNVSNKGNWTSFAGFAQSTAADQPLWTASTMGVGKSAITISNNFMQAAQNLTGSSWNSFIVMKFSGTNVFQPIKVTGTIGGTGSAWSNVYADRSNSRYANFFVEGGFQYRAGFTPFTGWTDGHVVQSYMSNSALTIVDYFSINNSAQTETNISNSVASTGAPGVFASPVFRIINEDGIYSDIPGEIGEMLFFNKELTTSQQSSLVNYLKTKWGIV